VFPTVRGDDRPIAKSTLNQAVKALGLDVEHFVLHDFRRTAEAHLLAMDQPADVIARALARASKEAANEPTRADDAANQRNVLQRWADFVEAQIADEPQSESNRSRAAS
jgi:integrase